MPMRAFSKLLQERGLTRTSTVRSTPPSTPSADGEAEAQRKEIIQYYVDNTLLQSNLQGLSFRDSPNFEAKASAVKPAAFGSVVYGVPHDEHWLRVGQYFLPNYVKNVPVLLRTSWVDTPDEEGTDVAETPSSQQISTMGSLKVPPVLRWEDEQKPADDAGVLYQVVFERIILRYEPSEDSTARAGRRKGYTVRAFEWDATKRWRRCYDKGVGWGWMMLDHPFYGPLLRPADPERKFSSRPLVPLCVAVEENNLPEVRRFIGERCCVDVRDYDQRTPLMLAAARGHLDCCVLLIEARADATLVEQQPERSTEQLQAAALLAALSGQPFNKQDYEIGRQHLQLDALIAADQLHDEVTNQKVQEANRRDGVPYTVERSSVWIRTHPRTDSERLSKRVQGDIVNVLEVDANGQWGRVEVALESGRTSGWMKLKDPDLGVLLRRVDVVG